MDTKTTPATVEELRIEVHEAWLAWIEAGAKKAAAREHLEKQREALRLAEQREALDD